MPEGGGADVEIAQHLSEHLGRKETPICQKIQVKKRLRSVKFHSVPERGLVPCLARHMRRFAPDVGAMLSRE
jgi:hypothetical protein